MTLKEATQVLASQPEFVYLRFSNGSEDVRRPTWTPGSIVVETRTMHGSQINCTLYSLDEMREATPEEIESFLQAEALPQLSAERNLLQLTGLNWTGEGVKKLKARRARRARRQALAKAPCPSSAEV